MFSNSRLVLSLVCIVMFIPSISAGDWNNSGANPQRNGMSDEIGPIGEDILWSGGRSSLIAWLPVTEGSRVFFVRQETWAGPGDALIVARDIDTGFEFWTYEIPYQTDDWTPWVAGVKNGIVYGSRSGNGASVSAKLYALDATDGGLLWISVDDIDAGPYDGVVFAPDGDPVIGSFQDIWRIDSSDGSTVWHTTRQASVSSSAGCCIYGDGVYIADSAGGGQVIKKYDLSTGTYLYESAVMSGFLTQTTPMAGPDGTIYFNRCQSNVATDFWYAWEDTGSDFNLRWSIPSQWEPTAEEAVGPDGSLYIMLPSQIFARVDPSDGSTIDSFPIPVLSKAHVATDINGNVYMSNGEFANGHLYAFTADLTPIWDTPVTNINIGGPALGLDGTLIVLGVGNDVRAYRSDVPSPTPLIASPTPEIPTATPGLTTPTVGGPTPTPPPIPTLGETGFGLIIIILTLLIGLGIRTKR